MIAYVKGKLVEVTEGVVIVDVNGIGYEIVCANPFYFQDKINQDVKINTYHHVREDAQILYGFRNHDEKHYSVVSLQCQELGLRVVYQL